MGILLGHPPTGPARAITPHPPPPPSPLTRSLPRLLSCAHPHAVRCRSEAGEGEARAFSPHPTEADQRGGEIALPCAGVGAAADGGGDDGRSWSRGVEAGGGGGWRVLLRLPPAPPQPPPPLSVPPSLPSSALLSPPLPGAVAHAVLRLLPVLRCGAPGALDDPLPHLRPPHIPLLPRRRLQRRGERLALLPSPTPSIFLTTPQLLPLHLLRPSTEAAGLTAR